MSQPLRATIEFFNTVGYTPPWVGYFICLNDNLVGSAACKGKPRSGRVEISYGVFPSYQRQGIGAEICSRLVRLALQTDPVIMVTARTMPEENYSTRILRKNKVACVGSVWDEEGGTVWEWVYEGADPVVD